MTTIGDTELASYTTAMVQLLEHQRTLYRRLRLLAERQRALVVAEDHQPLMELLTERQRLVDGLVSLTTKLGPYRSEWTRYYPRMDEGTRKRITSMLEEVNTALASILQFDQQDTAMLKAQRDQTAQTISNLSNGRQAGAVYASAHASIRSVHADAEA